MKKILLAVLFVIPLFVFSQEEITLSKKNGVEVSYSLLLEEEGKKKDKYILIVNAVNNSAEDIYYNVPLIKGSNGSYSLSPFGQDKGFTKIKVRNSTGLFGDGKSILGDPTKFVTVEKHLLFIIKVGEIYTQETKFKVKSGVKPLITNTFLKTFKKLSDFNLEITKDMLDGIYISSCGDFSFNLELGVNGEKNEILTQSVNSRYFSWIRENNLNFKREDIPGYTLVFDKNKKVFKYSSSDGVKCVWSKK